MQHPPAATAHTLKNGEVLHVEVYQPGVTAPPASLEAIRDLVVQPQQPWFGPNEREEVERGLWGTLADTSQDYYFLGRIGTVLAGVTWYQVSRRSPVTGAFGYVFTEPAHRGKGISQVLCEAAIAHFQQRGGWCLYLGTANPVAHHIYEKCGFYDYNGIVMRSSAPPHAREGFDRTLFGEGGPATVRPVEWGDSGMIDALYAAPLPWFIRDYHLHSFSHPAVVQNRCHIFPSIMVPVARDESVCLVLETSDHRLVGAARLHWSDRRVEPHVGLVDFVIYPGYASHAAGLLRALLAAAAARGVELARVSLASCDQEKQQIVQACGFQLEAVLSGQLRAGTQTFDLALYGAALT